MDYTDQFEREDDYSDEPEREPIFDMPAIPTDFLPGSVFKIDALRSRYELGEPLWHDGDMTFERYGESILENPGTISTA